LTCGVAGARFGGLRHLDRLTVVRIMPVAKHMSAALQVASAGTDADADGSDPPA
jgi:hypothetical protein